MYIAKSASLRTADLSRQVGAAIFSEDGEVISLGSNEVPKAGGGTYWTDDPKDARDYKSGFDPNDIRQREIISRPAQQASWWRASFAGTSFSKRCIRNCISTDGLKGGALHPKFKIMDLLEFGRIVHAEMSALSDAARKGVPVQHGTLYCTTFPCHMCAKHIVASGIDRVVYLEPYQKSYAFDLHSDAISVDAEEIGKAVFKTFIGISPFRYRDLFERRKKRKNDDGEFQEWYEGKPLPNLQIYDPGYQDAEMRVAAAFNERLDALKDRRPVAEQLELSAR